MSGISVAQQMALPVMEGVGTNQSQQVSGSLNREITAEMFCLTAANGSGMLALRPIQRALTPEEIERKRKHTEAAQKEYQALSNQQRTISYHIGAQLSRLEAMKNAMEPIYTYLQVAQLDDRYLKGKPYVLRLLDRLKPLMNKMSQRYDALLRQSAYLEGAISRIQGTAIKELMAETVGMSSAISVLPAINGETPTVQPITSTDATPVNTGSESSLASLPTSADAHPGSAGATVVATDDEEMPSTGTTKHPEQKSFEQFAKGAALFFKLLEARDVLIHKLDLLNNDSAGRALAPKLQTLLSYFEGLLEKATTNMVSIGTVEFDHSVAAEGPVPQPAGTSPDKGLTDLPHPNDSQGVLAIKLEGRAGDQDQLQQVVDKAMKKMARLIKKMEQPESLDGTDDDERESKNESQVRDQKNEKTNPK